MTFLMVNAGFLIYTQHNEIPLHEQRQSCNDETGGRERLDEGQSIRDRALTFNMATKLHSIGPKFP